MKIFTKIVCVTCKCGRKCSNEKLEVKVCPYCGYTYSAN